MHSLPLTFTAQSLSQIPLRFRLLTDSSPFLWEFVDVHFPETSGRRRTSCIQVISAATW